MWRLCLAQLHCYYSMLLLMPTVKKQKDNTNSHSYSFYNFIFRVAFCPSISTTPLPHAKVHQVVLHDHDRCVVTWRKYGIYHLCLHWIHALSNHVLPCTTAVTFSMALAMCCAHAWSSFKWMLTQTRVLKQTKVRLIYSFRDRCWYWGVKHVAVTSQMW